MQEWICKMCGYIYIPSDGDPKRNVEEDTPFERLPDDWVCPDCEATKDRFEPLDE